MRLSATDRIIREAEQHDDAAVEEVDHPDTEKVSAAPFVALGIPAPRMPTPLGGGVDIDIEDDDGGQDEEGETQVDAKRSAAALKEMRALQGSVHTSPPQTTSPSGAHRPRGVPPGRPGGTSAMNLTPAPVAMPAALATAPTNTTLAFGTATVVGPAPKAPAPPRLPGFTPPPVLPDDNRPDHMFSSSRIQFGAVAMPPPAGATSGLSMAPRRSGRVGRRTGVVIAASTALAVALIAGAWTAKNTAPVRTVISRPSLTPSLVRGATAATPPRAAITPVVVATPPIAKAPEPAEAPPAPEAAVPAPAPAATEAAPAPTTAPTRTAPLSKRAQAAAAKLEKKKAKLAKRKAALAAAAARRKARAHKTTKTAVAAPAPTVAAPAASPAPRPAASRPSEAPRSRMDPDDTLPITD